MNSYDQTRRRSDSSNVTATEYAALQNGAHSENDALENHPTTVEPDQHSSSSETIQPDRTVENEELAKPQSGEQASQIRPWDWRTTSSIIGFYMLAVLSAVSHFCLFTYLDGRIVSQDIDTLFRETTSIPQSYVDTISTTSIPQSYITTISLLIVTTFRATLVASIGVSYVQYMWMMLRRQLFEVQIIEELFQIRANVFRLLNKKLVRNAPSLVLVATISWLIPLATIYPPGALILSLESRQVPGVDKIPIMPQYESLDDFPTVFGSPFADMGFARMALNNETPESTRYTLMSYHYSEPISSMHILAKSILVNRVLPQVQHLQTSNASYTMNFLGPTMQCREFNSINITSLGEADFSSQETQNPGAVIEEPELQNGQFRKILKTPFNALSLWSQNGSIILESMYRFPGGRMSSFSHCPNSHMSETEPEFQYGKIENGTLLRPVNRTECIAAVTDYNVDIKIINGEQHIEYTTGEVRPLIPVGTVDWPNTPLNATFGSLKSWKEYINVLALIDSMTMNFDLTGRSIDELWFDRQAFNRVGSARLENATVNNTCNTVHGKAAFGGWTGHEIFKLSSFFDYGEEGQNMIPPKPAGSKINLQDTPRLNETVLNEVLANITIGALSLNRYQGRSKINTTQLFNVYRFERRINFFLPYGLCLFFGIPILVSGLLALRYNGVSAIDGGFLQILMTSATGETTIEKSARAGCLGGTESVPKELKNLEVRFGTLVAMNHSSITKIKPHDAETGVNTRQPHDTQETSRDGTASASLLDNYDAESRRSESFRVDLASGVALRGSDSTLVRRAGFGTLDETMPLRKGDQLGRV